MSETTPAPFVLADIAVSVFRAPIDRPVRTAFGVMTDRPAVIVRAVERDGTTGFGEVWSNFPQCGAEHRARLVKSALVPLLLDRSSGTSCPIYSSWALKSAKPIAPMKNR